MKKLLLLLIALTINTYSCASEQQLADLKKGIELYKSENYTGTMQILQEHVEKNPGSALAHYYLGMAYVRVGKLDLAKSEYEKVIILDPGSQLAEYAKLGSKVIYNDIPTQESATTTNNELKFNDFLSDSVKQQQREQNIDLMIENINKGKEVTPHDLEKFEKFNPINKSEAPSSQEIAEALQVLQRAGINPAGMNTQMAMNPELMQMNMLMNTMGGQGGMSQSNNQMNNIMPMLMMMQQQGQNGGNIDPKMIQSVITSTMMPSMMNFYEQKDSNYF